MADKLLSSPSSTRQLVLIFPDSIGKVAYLMVMIQCFFLPQPAIRATAMSSISTKESLRRVIMVQRANLIFI